MIRLKITWGIVRFKDAITYLRLPKIDNIIVKKDIPYTPNLKRKNQRFDLALPSEKGKHKVILNIHGGGWVYGHKDKIYGLYGQSLAKEGYAVATLNYRLAPKVSLKEQVQDIFSCIATLQDKNRFPMLDMNHFYLVGDSAGAHLSALTALLLQKKSYQEVFGVHLTQSVKAVGLNCGLYYLRGHPEIVNPKSFLKLHMRALFNRKDYHQSPYFEIANIAEHLDQSFPPVYLMSSELDFLHKDTLKLAGELKKYKIKYRLDYFAKEKKLIHVFHLKHHQQDSMYVKKRMVEFFKQNTS